MRYVDLKNDMVFRRVFGHQLDLLRALLNDLLSRRGPRRFVALTLLPSEESPVGAGAKRSLVEVKALEQSGRACLVEVQALYVPGGLPRVVHDACRTYVGQTPRGRMYSELTDVIELALCDFVAWPAPLKVPLVSHWSLREEASGHVDLGQVTYAFVELPKLDRERDALTAAERWVRLLRAGAFEGDAPRGLGDEQRAALALCHESKFTRRELEAYRKIEDEIGQARRLADDRWHKGLETGVARGKAEAILWVLTSRGLSISEAVRERVLATSDTTLLDRWLSAAISCASADDLTAR